MKRFTLLLYAIPALLMVGCTSDSLNASQDIIQWNAEYLHQVNIALEQDIVHDFFPPPVASRIYMYPNLAAYEIMSQSSDNYLSLRTAFPDFPQIPTCTGADHEMASLYCFLMLSREMLYTTAFVDAEEKRLDSLFASLGIRDQAKKYASEVVKVLLPWMKEDQYAATRNKGDYTLLQQPGTWVPTPPDYLDALEPHWQSIRPMSLDSAGQFAPPPPTPFDMTEGSPYYKELMEVYNAVAHGDDSTLAMAKFWDCNPIVSRHEGHFTYSVKKLTPGGHWMNIQRIASRATKQSFIEACYSYSGVTIGLFDGFISCWHTKYATHYIRPVTAIQNSIDPNWLPLLITPNFPEYTSGHSVVSRSAATILTHVYGDHFAFTDSSEAPYGMPSRSFDSFIQASDEAAISRFHGGIHYKPAIYNGVIQGEKIGLCVIDKIKKLRK